MAPQHGPPKLGTDGVVRFDDAEHFLRELAENLRRGRLFVRAAPGVETEGLLNVEIEGPGAEWNVGATATVVLRRKDYIGLEIEDFDAEVAPTLDLLADEVKASLRAQSRKILKTPGGESTVIQHMPDIHDLLNRNRPTTSERPAPRRRRRVASEGIESEPRTPPPTRRKPATRRVPQGVMPEVYARGDLDDLAKALEVPTPAGTRPSASADLAEPPIPAARRVTEAVDPISEPAVARPSVAPPSTREDFDAPSFADPAETTPAPSRAPPPAPTRAPAPAALAGPLDGLEEMREADLALPRATPGGVLKMRDPSNLLGIYLSQIRHGHLTVWGGPDGEVGESVSLKVASQHVATLSCKIVSRLGDWVTLEVEDEWPVVALLKDSVDEWFEALKDLGADKFSAATSHTIPPEPMTPGPASVAAPAPVVPSVAPPPPKSGIPADAPGDDGPPELPTLAGNVVTFRRRKDLEHEVDTNLQNGGLSTKSGVLPIREHRTLKVSVGGTMTDVAMEADVVFAANGMVGWSVGHFSDVVDALREALDGPEHVAPTATASPPSVGPPRPSAPPAEAMSGRIIKPFTLAELVGMQGDQATQTKHLDRANVLKILEFLARQELTGILTLKLKDEIKKLWYHEGSVAFVNTNPPDDEQKLGRILIHHKKLNETALRECLERARAQNKPVGRTLVAMGHVKATVIAAALREQMRAKVEPAFGWSVGSWEWRPWTDPPTNADLVLANGMGFVARHIRYRYEHVTSNEMDALFGKNMTRRVQCGPDIDKRAAGLGVNAKELRFIELTLDGTRSVSEAVTGSPLGRLASLRLVASGLSIGLLSFTDGEAGLRGRSQAARQPTDARGHDALRKSIEEHTLLMKSQNHFEVLGVHWSASHRSFGAAAEKAKAQFDADKPPLNAAPPDVKRLAREALKIVEAAQATLEDRDKRIRYRKELFDSTEREYSADMLIKQGEVLLLRGDRMGGIEAFETAYELSPSSRIRTMLEAAREGRAN